MNLNGFTLSELINDIPNNLDWIFIGYLLIIIYLIIGLMYIKIFEILKEIIKEIYYRIIERLITEILSK